MKTYKVTSPLMRGEEVKRLQRRLAGANAFKENFRPGKIDGNYGEDTAAAAYRAKYWLGYPTTKINRRYGTTLDSMLSGKNKLPPAYKTRRTSRKKAAKAMPMRTKALREARKHVGKKESPAGSNRVLFSRWYGVTGPWCAMFTTYCYDKFSKTFIRGKTYAYVPYILEDARRGGRGLMVTHNPEPGDLVIYNWDGGVPDHIGLFEKWLGEGRFQSIEGNTSVGNDSNGGEVMVRERKLDHTVAAFVRVTK